MFVVLPSLLSDCVSFNNSTLIVFSFSPIFLLVETLNTTNLIKESQTDNTINPSTRIESITFKQSLEEFSTTSTSLDRSLSLLTSVHSILNDNFTVDPTRISNSYSSQEMPVFASSSSSSILSHDTNDFQTKQINFTENESTEINNLTESSEEIETMIENFTIQENPTSIITPDLNREESLTLENAKESSNLALTSTEILSQNETTLVTDNFLSSIQPTITYETSLEESFQGSKLVYNTNSDITMTSIEGESGNYISRTENETINSEDLTLVPSSLISDEDKGEMVSLALTRMESFQIPKNESYEFFTSVSVSTETDLPDFKFTETVNLELNESSLTHLDVSSSFQDILKTSLNAEDSVFSSKSSLSNYERSLSTYFQETNKTLTSIINIPLLSTKINDEVINSPFSSLEINETVSEVNETLISTYTEESLFSLTENETQSEVSNTGINETYATAHSEKPPKSLTTNESNIEVTETMHASVNDEDISSSLIQSNNLTNNYTSTTLLHEESSVIEPSFSSEMTNKPSIVNYSLYSTQAYEESTILSELNSSYSREYSTNAIEESLSISSVNESSSEINGANSSSSLENVTHLSSSHQSDFEINSLYVYSGSLAGNNPSLMSIYTEDFNNATSLIVESSNPSDYNLSSTDINDIASTLFENEEASSYVSLQTTLYEETNMSSSEIDRNQTILSSWTVGNESSHIDVDVNSTESIVVENTSKFDKLTTTYSIEASETIANTVIDNFETSVSPLLTTNASPGTLTAIIPSSVVPDNSLSTSYILINDSLTEPNSTFEPTTLPTTINPTLSLNETLKKYWVFTG